MHASAWLVVAATSLLLAGCEPRPGAGSAAVECSADADCVPATCCHASACLPRAEAPDCRQVMCTRECRAGTIDCGGGCVCRDGRCAARIMNAPAARDTVP